MQKHYSPSPYQISYEYLQLFLSWHLQKIQHLPSLHGKDMLREHNDTPRSNMAPKVSTMSKEEDLIII